MESKKINQLATELTPSLSDLTIIGDPSTGISKKITLSQMASLFTGTVEEYASLAAFPLVGVADTIYIALDTNVLYRWDTGLTSYVELSPNIINSLVFNDANGFDGTISLVGSVATLTITTALTAGSVPFIGSSGALTQDNANLFFDDTNNRLGINTNSPTTALDIFGSGIIGRVNGTSTNNAFLGFASAGTNKWSIGNVQSDHRFRIYSEANTAELVSVLQTGEFGIGIANPTTKLHIDGGASALIANLDANVSVAKTLSFRSDNSNRINLEVSGTESGSNSGADLFIRRYSDAGALIDTALTIKRNTGWIGIGTLTPTRQLFVNGTAFFDNLGSGTTTDPSIAIGSTTVGLSYIGGGAMALLTGANTRQYITSTGLIGINTINPTARFQIHGAPDSNYGTLCVFDTTTSAIGTGGMIAFGGYKNNTSNEALYAQLIGAKENATLSNEAGYFAIKVNTGSAYAERFRILSTGQIGIGTATVDSSLSVDIQNQSATSSNVFLRLKNNSTSEDVGFKVVGNTGGTAYEHTFGVNTIINSSDFIFHNSNTLGYRWIIDGVDRTRITPTGYLKQSYNGTYVNGSGGFNEFSNNQSGEPVITSTCYGSSISDAAIYFAPFEIDHNNTTAMFFRGRGGANTRIRIYSNGNIQNTNNSYTALSDIKLKENIVDTSSKLEDLLKVRIVNYNLIGDNLKQIGVVAQELEQIFPGLVYESPDIEEKQIEKLDEEGNLIKEIIKTDLGTTTKSVKYSIFVPMLIKAIQEQQAQIEELKILIAAK
jgi:hypothetical protein